MCVCCISIDSYEVGRDGDGEDGAVAALVPPWLLTHRQVGQ